MANSKEKWKFAQVDQKYSLDDKRELGELIVNNKKN